MVSDKFVGVAIAFWMTSSGVLSPPKHLTLSNPINIDTIEFWILMRILVGSEMDFSQYVIKKIEAYPLSGNDATLSYSVVGYSSLEFWPCHIM